MCSAKRDETCPYCRSDHPDKTQKESGPGGFNPTTLAPRGKGEFGGPREIEIGREIRRERERERERERVRERNPLIRFEV